MAGRKREIDEKVEPVKTALDQINVEKAARDAGVPASTLRYDLDKLEQALPEVLADRKRGPKPEEKESDSTVEQVNAKEPVVCPQCGDKAAKNGTYWALNWVLMLTVGWLGVQRTLIQRWRCKRCKREIHSPERTRQAKARRAWWMQVDRLIGLSRFKLGLSVRRIQILTRFVYGKAVSVGHVQRLTHRVGEQAEVALSRLSQCRQAVARFLMFDETFPKMARRAYSLGVAICEHGLIRSVRCVTRKARDIPAQLRETVGEHFRPTHFLTDLDVMYNSFMQAAGLDLIHLRDRGISLGRSSGSSTMPCTKLPWTCARDCR